jgi:hypothetical protein
MTIAIDPKYGSRKFIVALLIIIVTFVLGLLSTLSGTQVTVILTAIGGGYGFTNLWAKRMGVD